MKRVIPFLSVIFILAATATSTSAQEPGYSLRDEADRAGIRFGSAAQWWMPEHADPRYLDLLDRQANTITFENETKWLAIHPEPGRYDFSSADTLAEWAQSRGMRMRGHALVWHSRVPAWVNALEPTREEAIALMRDHIYTVVGHFRDQFPGLVTDWDVVNEPIDNDGTLRNSVWQRWIGDDYIDLAFRFAREAAGPGVALYLNEYFDDAAMASAENAGGDADDGDPVPMTTPGATGSNSCAEVVKCAAARELVVGLLDRGTPIDGVGFQGHLLGAVPSDYRALTTWVGELGLSWALTELDRPMRTSESWARDIQAAQFAAAAQSCVDDPACNTVVTWGLSDEYTWWRPASGSYYFDALPFDDIDGGFAPKPAADALYDVFAQAPNQPMGPTPSKPTAGLPSPSQGGEAGLTGRRARALRKCDKKLGKTGRKLKGERKRKGGKKRKKCRRKAKKLPR